VEGEIPKGKFQREIPKGKIPNSKFQRGKPNF